MANKITQSELKECLKYDPDTGVFTWINTIHKKRLSHAAGSVSTPSKSGNRYIKIHVCGKRYLAHHLAWLYVTGSLPDGVMDHIDGNGENNKFSNLRCVTSTENSRNIRLKSNNTSGVCGVVWYKKDKKWRAQIGYRENGIAKQETIGQFDCIDEAIKARLNREAELGFHVNHGKPRAYEERKDERLTNAN